MFFYSYLMSEMSGDQNHFPEVQGIAQCGHRVPSSRGKTFGSMTDCYWYVIFFPHCASNILLCRCIFLVILLCTMIMNSKYTNETTFYYLSYDETNGSNEFTQTIRNLKKQQKLVYLVLNTDIRISIFYSINISK